MKNNFEDIIRESLTNHEVPYEAGAWEKFQSNLPTSTPFYKSKWFIGSVAALVIAGIVGYNSIPESVDPINNSTTQEITQNQSNTTENTEITPVVTTEENTTEIEVKDINKETEASEINSDLVPTPTTSHDSSIPNNKTAGNKTNDINNLITPETKGNGIENKPNPTPPVKEVKVKEIVDYKNNFTLAETTCEGESIVLTPDNYSPNHTYKWIVNNGLSTFNGRIITLNPSVTGNTTVKLIVTDENGKQLTSITKKIVVNKRPEGAIQITKEEHTTYNSYKITSYNSGNSVYWNMGDGTTSSENTFSHSYKRAGIYTVEYTLTNRNGCHLTETKKIEVEGLYNIREDYGFSPNGDNLNDDFIPNELKELNVQFEMNVYSRSGQLIYTTTSVDRPWNGNLKDGTKSPFGSYVWVVTLTNENGVNEVYKGTITNVTN